MNSTSPLLKRRAKELIGATKPSAITVSFVWFIINAAVSYLYSFVSGYYKISSEITQSISLGAVSPNMLERSIEYVRPGGVLLSIALGICISVISAGFSWYCLRVARGESPEIKSLFNGFEQFLKIIGLQLLTGFLILLQTLLFIIPGILAAIRYSQAIYILHDNKDLGVLECIRRSSKMMKGNKTRYFVLVLSFLGWIIVGLVVEIFLFVPVLDVWINIYLGVTTALFYISMSEKTETLL